MKGIASGCARTVLALAAVLGAVHSFAADPSPQEIAEGWAKLSGRKAGRVVYWKGNKIWVLDLTTGRSNSVAPFTTTAYDEATTGHPKFSPNGKRIVWTRNYPGGKVVVTNADGDRGTNVADFMGGRAAWWGNDWVCYSTGKWIVRTRLDETNRPLETVVVVSERAEGKYYRYVEMSGDYVSYTDSAANISYGGYHRSVVRNWKTGKLREVNPRDGDACGITMQPDGKGTVCFNPENHKVDAPIETFDGTLLGKMRPLPGRKITYMRWSNHADFMAHNDGGRYSDPDSQRMWIRKISTQEALFLGSGGWSPDLWVGGSSSGDQVPAAIIAQPAGGSTVNVGDTISYTGSASDPEDGQLGGAQLLWEYDILGDGQGRTRLGSGGGGGFAAPAHPKGANPYTLVLYLAATDSGGLRHEVSVKMTVSAAGTAVVLQPPSDLSAEALSGSHISLTWTDNADNEEGFRIYRDDGSGFVAIASTPANQEGYDDKTPTAGTTYTYRLVAYRGTEESKAAKDVTATAAEPYVKLLAPNGGEGLTMGEMMEVRWETNQAAYDARISLSTDGGQTWQVLQFSWAPNGSPWPWKVGCKNVQTDPTRPPVWKPVVTVGSANCLILVEDYLATPVLDRSDAPFEISFSGTDSIPPSVRLVALGLRGTVDDSTVRGITVAGSVFPLAGGAFEAAATIGGRPGSLQVNATDAAGHATTRVLHVIP